MALMVMGGSIFATGFIGKGKTAAEYEAAIKTSKKSSLIYNVMALECIKNPKITEDFDAYKAKFEEVCKTYNIKEDAKLGSTLPHSIRLLALANLYEPCIKFTNYENTYVNIYYVDYGIWQIDNKDEFIKWITATGNKNVIVNDYRYCNIYLKIIRRYQNLLTPEETVKYLKNLRRNIYSNISKSEDWKQVVVQVELMIKANE